MDPDRLKGKNILITGAAHGMGAANAEHFAEQGANVCLGDLDVDEAQKVADAINERGNGKAIAVQDGRHQARGQRRRRRRHRRRLRHRSMSACSTPA